MIARENLEARKQTLATRIGVLALEKLDHIEKVERLGAEMLQIAVLLKVLDATLTDLAEDEASMDKRIDSLEESILDLEANLAAGEVDDG